MAEQAQLTTKERATLIRRRNNLTVAKAASKIGCHRNTLARRERDGEVAYGTIEPTPTEMAYIKRKRLGMTQLECAVLLGISRVWYGLMENGEVRNEMLLKFWEK